jgi:hypothetical protein
MTDGMDNGTIRIRITPEPTDEEMAAIVGVVTAVAASSRSEPSSAERLETRWRRMGRLESLREATWPPEMIRDT